MAVTVRNYNIDAFWNSDTLLDALQTALADVGYHAPAQTGTILTFTNTAGTTILSERGKRYLVKQSATSGSGQYCTFDILRNSTTGAVSTVTLVNGGENYAISNTITIAGATLGGTTPTDNITITVSTVSGSQGSTSTWYDKDTTSPYTWGVCCVNNDTTKKMGQTYYTFHTPANPTVNPILYIRAGAGFQSTTNVFNGVSGLDWVTAAVPNSTTQQNYSQVIATTNAVPLTLTTYQSAVDTNFVVFQFSEAGPKYGKLYRWPFFLSKYSNALQPWSLDDCFTGGIYEIGKVQVFNTYDAAVYTATFSAPMAKRQGEWGYGTVQGTYANAGTIIGYYESLFGKKTVVRTLVQYPTVYQRTLVDLAQTSLEYNPVVTNIPVCNVFIPIPYYIPADFGVTEVIATNSIEYLDRISVGATTKWTILQYAVNQAAATYNSAMAFVAKTTD